jgi:hypothetical protein
MDLSAITLPLVENTVTKIELHKIRERKVRTLTKN